uniref:Uncharacterized protein n=1 Tax=Rhinopithecus bieti TaxID=61621 RepID=A0A2K6L0A7_RHIBE
MSRSGSLELLEEKETQIAYDVNPRTTEILHHLSEPNRVRDRDDYLVIEDLKQKYLQDLLMDSVNFFPANFSSTGSRYLNALVDSVVALERKDDLLASFILAVNDLTSDLFRNKSEGEEIKIELEKLEKNLTRISRKQRLHLSTERAKVDTRHQNMNFLKAKSEEFRFGIKATEEQLSARGMDASLSHQSLVALSEKLAKLKQQTISLKKKFESYLDLMPNSPLTQVKIEEAKQELHSNEAELTRRVDMTEL